MAATKSITAQNSFSPEFVPGPGRFNFSLSGSWVATVHLQRSYDGGATFFDVDSYTANTEIEWSEAEYRVVWRFGVKSGNFTSGTIVGRLSK